MYIITGASGQLGHLVVKELAQRVPTSEIAALFRTPSKAEDLKALGVTIRYADYDKPETLPAAFKDADKVLIISGNEVGKRLPQHKAIIAAAKAAGAKLLAYTSLLSADTSPLLLAAEHKATEEALAQSALPFIILRNGWYAENYAGFLPMAVKTGTLIGAAGEGRISAATRQDYAEAAAVVLTQPQEPNTIYELAGDTSYSLAELAAEAAHQSGATVHYENMTPKALAAAFGQIGLPQPIIDILSDADAHAANGALFHSSRDLHRLIGRDTAPVATIVKAALV